MTTKKQGTPSAAGARNGKAVRTQEEITTELTRILTSLFIDRANYNQFMQLDHIHWLYTRNRQMYNLRAGWQETERHIHNTLALIRFKQTHDELQVHCIEAIHDLFKPPLKKNALCPQNIFSYGKIFLTAYCNALQCTYPVPLLTHLSMTDAEIEAVAAAATSIYLEEWLFHDTNAHITIAKFARNPYSLRDEKIPETTYCDIKHLTDPLYAAYKEYQLYFCLRQEQAKQNNEKPTPMPYSHKMKATGAAKSGSKESPAKKHAKDSAKQKEREKNACLHYRLLDFVTLAWCNAYKEKYLRFLYLLFHGTKPMYTTTSRGVNRHQELKYALMRYNDWLRSINTCYEDEKSDPQKIREYVANCILLQKIERTYHFQLSIQLADQLEQNALALSDINQNLAAFFWAPSPDCSGTLFTPPQSGKKSFARIHEQYDVLNYGDKISAICLNCEGSDRKRADWAAHKGIQIRWAICDLLTLLYTLCPLEKPRQWRDKEFQDAADFFHNQYNLASAYLQYSEGEKSSQFFETYRQIYDGLNNLENAPLKSARDVINPPRS